MKRGDLVSFGWSGVKGRVTTVLDTKTMYTIIGPWPLWDDVELYTDFFQEDTMLDEIKHWLSGLKK